jgi:hypothetical protein
VVFDSHACTTLSIHMLYRLTESSGNPCTPASPSCTLQAPVTHHTCYTPTMARPVDACALVDTCVALPVRRKRPADDHPMHASAACIYSMHLLHASAAFSARQAVRSRKRVSAARAPVWQQWVLHCRVWSVDRCHHVTPCVIIVRVHHACAALWYMHMLVYTVGPRPVGAVRMCTTAWPRWSAAAVMTRSAS